AVFRPTRTARQPCEPMMKLKSNSFSKWQILLKSSRYPRSRQSSMQHQKSFQFFLEAVHGAPSSFEEFIHHARESSMEAAAGSDQGTSADAVNTVRQCECIVVKL
ncbi:unnamed protein product, partial [Durusdinium trenchii]